MIPAWLATLAVKLAGALIDVGARELCRRGRGDEARRRIERAEDRAEARRRVMEESDG